MEIPPSNRPISVRIGYFQFRRIKKGFHDGCFDPETLLSRISVCVALAPVIYSVQVEAAVLGDRLPEVTQSLCSAHASLCSAGIERERARKCLQGYHFVRRCHSTHSLLLRGSPGVARGSAAVWDPNPPRPFARSRCKSET